MAVENGRAILSDRHATSPIISSIFAKEVLRLLYFCSSLTDRSLYAQVSTANERSNTDLPPPVGCYEPFS